LLNRLAGTPARITAAIVLIMAVAAPSAAQQAGQPAAGQTREHVVRRGDTLWDLARLYLANPFLWPMIFEANRDVVQNPHWIYPAERLIIPSLLQQRVEEPVPIPAEPSRVTVAVEVPAADGPPTTITTLDMRRPVLSAGEYVRLPWLSGTADAGTVARIRQRADDGSSDGRIASALYPNERVLLQLTGGTVVAGDTLVAVRPGRRLGSHGTVMEPLALLRVDSVTAGAAVARIISQFAETRVGDLLIRQQPMPAFGQGQAELVEGGAEGQIIDFLIRQSMYATTDLAFVSLGAGHGLGIGDELLVYVPPAAGVPATSAGVLRVVRVGETSATARVISVTGTNLRAGLPVRVVKRMP
jgi:hypothetical protein